MSDGSAVAVLEGRFSSRVKHVEVAGLRRGRKARG